MTTQINSKYEIQKISLDVFPSLNGRNFEEFSSAVVHSYISPNENRGYEENLKRISKLLASQDWIIASTLSIDAFNYTQTEMANLAEIVKKTQYRGFHFEVERSLRQWIYKSSCTSKLSAKIELESFRKKIANSQQFFSLYSKKFDQFANGVLENSDELIPIWAIREDAECWLDHYPSYEIRPIPLVDYLDDIVNQLNIASMFVAIGSQSKYLMTIHPNAVI